MFDKLKSTCFFSILTLMSSNGLFAQEIPATKAADLKDPLMVILHGEVNTPLVVPPGNVVPNHIKEFGFYHSGWFSTDKIVDSAPFSTFVNLVIDRNLTENLEAAKKNGVKVWIELFPTFFSRKVKRDDFYERWQVVKAQLKPYEDIIYALDPLDEPFHKTPMSDYEMADYLNDIGYLLESDFPNAKRAITLTKDSVGKFKKSGKDAPYDPNKCRFAGVMGKICEGYLPGSYNLFGADYYAHVDFQEDVVNDLMYITRNHLADYYIIPKAFKSTNYTNMTEEQLVNRARQAYDFATQNEGIVAIYPFVWVSFEDSKHSYVGTEDLPTLRKEYERIGKAIKLFRE
ncbi:hypothetical protein [Microbulbifer sp. TRSA005]|uniref:hypothetical protein n=1 Tax=Microbulbifer sp. TRSA005 TaxID=3243383 RepID=UPI004039782B